MATRVVVGSVMARFRHILSLNKINGPAHRIRLSHSYQTETGALYPSPEKTRFGLLKVTAVVAPVVTFGGYLSMEFAAWLEDTELFVPDDDDDD